MIKYKTNNIEKYIQDFYFEDLEYVPGNYLDYIPRGFKGSACYVEAIEPKDKDYVINICMETIDEETLSENSIVVKKGTQLEMYVLVDDRVACFVPPSFSKIPVLAEITDVAHGKFSIRCIGIGENYCKNQAKVEKRRNEFRETMKLRNDTETILNLFKSELEKLEKNGKTDSEDYKKITESISMSNKLLKIIDKKLDEL